VRRRRGLDHYEALVAATLPHGVMPAVVPELKTITLGGAAAGVGIEASSFRHGLVHETLLELDVPDRQRRGRHVPRDNAHADLFYGFPNSYGTLGYALRLRARRCASQPYVRITQRGSPTPSAFFSALEAACRSDADFVDGVAFAPGELYLNTGRFASAAPYTSDYTYERIFYQSIREREQDYLTVYDFIWRWDTDWFWCSKNIGAQNPLVRRLFGRKRLGSRTYQKIMRWNSRWKLTGRFDRWRHGHVESVIQDVDVPLATAERFLHFFQREVPIAPVWICPLRAGARRRPFRAVPDEARRAVRQLRLLGRGAHRADARRRPLQPPGGARSGRARRHQVAVLRELLLARGFRRSVWRPYLPRAQAPL
jgi:FAD/FMN-containing dehydrogenase